MGNQRDGVSVFAVKHELHSVLDERRRTQMVEPTSNRTAIKETKPPKEGDKCKDCGATFRTTTLITSPGCNKEGATFLACRCLHHGDFFCNCGNPCYSFF